MTERLIIVPTDTQFPPPLAPLQLSRLVNECDDRGHLPLDLALSSGQTALAETLLEHRADPDARDDRGRRPLHLAVGRGDAAACLFLLGRRGCRADAALDSTLETPLHLAAARPGLDAEVAEKLVRKGANVNAQDKDSRYNLPCFPVN